MKGIQSLSLAIIIFLSSINITINEPCNDNHIQTQITPCKMNKRNILFYYDDNQCDLTDTKSHQLPSALIGVECKECLSGSFLTYNLNTKSLQCNDCPKDTYSIAGNFRLNGAYNEWSQDSLSLFKSNCAIYYNHTKYTNCRSMTTSADKSYIKSGHSINLVFYGYSYIVQMSKVFTLVKPGRVWFSYKKDTIKQGVGIGETISNGIFRFHVNYLLQMEDDSVSFDYKEYSVNLPIGTYSLLWQYTKEVNAFQSNDMSMYIESIYVEGIDTAAIECIPCIMGNSDTKSDHCNLCPKDQYFNKEMNQCLKCPNGTHSLPNSLGESSCIPNPICTMNDYKEIKSDKCNQKTRKMKITYELINKECMESKPLKEDEIDCIDCLPGQYLYRIDSNYFKCEYCPLKTYSDGINYLNCKACHNDPKRISYYFPQSSFSFSNDNIIIGDDKGHIKIIYAAIDPRKQALIEAKIDGIFLREILAPSFKIRLTKGKHDIKITITNAILKIIQVHHSTIGGGYECESCSIFSNEKDESGEGININIKPETCGLGCPPGSEFSLNSQCVTCKDNFFKATTSSTDECMPCPKLTISNPTHTNCLPLNIVTHPSNKIKINIESIKAQQSKLCLMTDNLCHNTFYGPLKDKSSLFFMSPFISNQFTSTDFNYIFENQSNQLPSFVYMLQNHNSQGTKIKSVHSLGSEIKSIKFVRGNKTRGLVMHYINGDNCIEDSKRKYSSVIFIKCLKDQDDILTLNTPKYLNKNDCKYYFEWSSKAACPICLNNEVSSLTTPCIKLNRSVYYHEGENCIITNMTQSTDITTEQEEKNESDIDVKELMILSKNIDIIKEFNIEDLMTIEENIAFSQQSSYVIQQIAKEGCLLFQDYDSMVIYLIIGILALYVIIVLICIVICCKYSKMKKGYHRLHEIPMDPTMTKETHISKENGQKLEIASNRIDISSTNEPNVLEQPEIEVTIHHNSNEKHEKQ